MKRPPLAAKITELEEKLVMERRATAHLRSALRIMQSVAEEVEGEWDAAPATMRPGKLLAALTGRLVDYRADITYALDALRLYNPWRPIGDAKKDGAQYLLYWPAIWDDLGVKKAEAFIAVGWWDAPISYAAHWTIGGRWTPGPPPTRFMALPPGPRT